MYHCIGDSVSDWLLKRIREMLENRLKQNKKAGWDRWPDWLTDSKAARSLRLSVLCVVVVSPRCACDTLTVGRTHCLFAWMHSYVKCAPVRNSHLYKYTYILSSASLWFYFTSWGILVIGLLMHQNHFRFVLAVVNGWNIYFSIWIIGRNMCATIEK